MRLRQRVRDSIKINLMLDSLSIRRIQQRTIIQIHSAEIQHLYFLEDTMRKAISSIGLLMTLAIPSGLFAQQAGYYQTNLVSNTAGVANTTDPELLNPWGISILPGQEFWIANNNSGTSTLYDNQGKKGYRPRSDHPRGDAQSER
jgi:hypothetical protein